MQCGIILQIGFTIRLFYLIFISSFFMNCISSKTIFLLKYTCACLYIIILLSYLMLIVELLQKGPIQNCMVTAKLG